MRGLRKQTTHKHATLLGILNTDMHARSLLSITGFCENVRGLVAWRLSAITRMRVRVWGPRRLLQCLPYRKPRQAEAAYGSSVRPCAIPAILSPTRGHNFPVVIPWTNYLPCCGARRCQTHTLAPTINIHTFFNKALKLMLTGLAEGPLSPTCLCELARFSVPRRSRLQRRGIDTHARAWAHTHTRTGILCLPGAHARLAHAGI